MDTAHIKKAIAYWRETADHDYDIMLYLYKGKKYSDALFYGHIVLEKILKAHVVKTTHEQPLRSHNLVRLHEIADLNFSPVDIDTLSLINEFNMRARYPEDNLEFYKKCTASYTKKYFATIIRLYKKLCQKLEPNQL